MFPLRWTVIPVATMWISSFLWLEAWVSTFKASSRLHRFWAMITPKA